MEKLSHSILERYISQRTENISDIYMAPPMLSYNRFDVAFKLAFLSNLKSQDFSKTKISYNGYIEHVKAFRFGECKEPGSNTKISIEDFVSEFVCISESIAENGFCSSTSVVPLSRDGSILNGAHRCASAIYHGKTIACVKTDLDPLNYNYSFFVNRGVASVFNENAALHYLYRSNATHVAIVWPSAIKYLSLIEKMLDKVVYKKELKLNYNGARNLVAEAYFGEAWRGSAENGFYGAGYKQTFCFKGKSNPVIILFDSDSLDQVIKIKEEIRSITGLEKHSIHITDTYDESIRLGFSTIPMYSEAFLNSCVPNLNARTSFVISTIESLVDGEENILSLNFGDIFGIYGFNEPGTETGFEWLPRTISSIEMSSMDFQDCVYIRGFGLPAPSLILEEARLANISVDVHVSRSLEGMAKSIASKSLAATAYDALRYYIFFYRFKVRELIVSVLTRLKLIEIIRRFK